jgi:hypothetical protein
MKSAVIYLILFKNTISNVWQQFPKALYTASTPSQEIARCQCQCATRPTRTRTRTMARFGNLPLDLFPQILVHLLIPDHLASLCLVSRTIYSFSVPKLYRRIVILPWHKSSKSKVCGISNEEERIKLSEKSSCR